MLFRSAGTSPRARSSEPIPDGSARAPDPPALNHLEGERAIPRAARSQSVPARRRKTRALRVLAEGPPILLAVVALVYLAGMNAFLKTHLFRDAISVDPASFLVDYTDASSFWPGRIHVEGLSIRGRDSHIEWILHLDRCDFRVSFADLAHKKFHARDVRGDGLSLRVRLRADVATPARVAALPPVPGFADPPRSDVGPPVSPLTEESYNLWSIELDDVVADHVRELWIDTIRYAGDLEIRGKWFFRPIRRLEVGPAILDVRALDVGYGLVERWASGVTGRLEVTVHPTNLEDVDRAALVDHVSLAGELTGSAQIANALDRAIEGRGVKFVAADAPFEVRALVDHGVLRSGTRAHLAAFHAEAIAGRFTVDGSLQADFQVDDRKIAQANLRLASARVSAVAQRRAEASAITATLWSRENDLSRPFSDATYEVDVRQAKF